MLMQGERGGGTTAPACRGWFWCLISDLLKLPQAPPGCSLLWFDTLVCHWVHAVWGCCVTAGPCHSWATQRHSGKRHMEKHVHSPPFISLLCSAPATPFLAPDVGVWKRHVSPSSLLQKALSGGFSAPFRKPLKNPESCGEWTNLFECGVGISPPRALLHLGRRASTLPGSFSNCTVSCAYLPLLSKWLG